MKNAPLPPPLAFVCPKIGEPMRQDGPGQRFCDHCQRHIHDLSAMSKTEGERFLGQAEGRVCISYQTRADGAMLVRTRWSGWQRRWNDLRRSVFTLLSLIAPLSFASCASRTPVTTTGGKVCVADADPKGTSSDPKDAQPAYVYGGMMITTPDVGRKHPLAWSAAPIPLGSEDSFLHPERKN